MMNILYIGPYRQGYDGWSIASRNYILALIKTGYNLSIRPIFLAGGNLMPDEDILEYEFSKYEKYDVIIQHTLPHYMVYDGRFTKNVGLIFTESSHLHYSSWIERLNLMDNIWAPTIIDHANLRNSFLRKEVDYVPIPADLSIYDKTYESMELPSVHDKFVFYWIGEFSDRKGLDVLVKAFHLEFDPNEPVSLLIKTNRAGIHPNQLVNHVMEYCNNIKRQLKLYPVIEQYHNEMIITDFMPTEDLYRLHNSCHCFVMPSRGDSWNIPCFDAIGFGRDAIVSAQTGPAKFTNRHIKTKEAPLISGDRPVAALDVFTGREKWNEPDIQSLMKHMRTAYNDKLYKDENYKAKCKERISKYSHENVGKTIKKLLELSV